MIQVTNTSPQTIQPGQSAVFDTTVLRVGNDTFFRPNGSAVTMRSKCSVYEVQFSANISSTATGTVQLAIALDGEPIPETTMANSIGTAGDPENASTATLVGTHGCCCGRLSVVNTGTEPAIINANPSLIVGKVC